MALGERQEHIDEVKGRHRPQGPNRSLQGHKAGETSEGRPCGLRNPVKMLVLPVRAKRGRCVSRGVCTEMLCDPTGVGGAHSVCSADNRLEGAGTEAEVS